MTDVQGHCDDRFAPVQAAFASAFDRGEERGAATYVTIDGEPVVDIWAGVATDDDAPWERDTIVNVWSTTKTMAGLCLLMLADRGEVDLHAPVATYWPEFAANGKEGVLVSHVMSHTTGVSGFEPAIAPTDLYDWDAVCRGLAAQEPWWEPGTQSGYHAITQGYLQGEIVRRVTGRSIGTFFREEVAEPLGADFHIGLPASEDGRVADMTPPPPADRRPSPPSPSRARSPCAPSSAARSTPPSPVPGAGGGPRSPPPAAPATPARSGASTPPWPAAARSTVCGCSPRPASSGSWRSRATPRTSCSA